MPSVRALFLALVVMIAGVTIADLRSFVRGVEAHGPGGSLSRTGGCSVAPKAGERAGSLMSGGLRRTYWLHVPPHLRTGHRTPLVLFFHQLGGDGKTTASGSDVVTVADRHGYVAAFPDATGSRRVWNVGPSPDGMIPSPRVDDVGFVSRLIKQLASQLCLDSYRVYASGFSAGGGMTYRVACALSRQIAAIAPESGVYTYAACHPSRPVSVIAFHGDADTSVPYRGNSHGLPDVRKWLAGWAQRDGCVHGPSSFFHGTDPFQTYKVTAVRYTGCRSRAEVQLYTASGEGHEPPPALGAMGRAVLPAELIWRFFSAHPLH